MTKLLASVRNLSEAEIALANGADIIDLKEPNNGALGAVDIQVLEQVLLQISGRRQISVTIGDLPMDATVIQTALSERARNGLDYVKIGIFPGGDTTGTLLAIKREVAAPPPALVAVLFADLHPDFSLLPEFAECGFSGVMVDTAMKQSGQLCDHVTETTLCHFVEMAHQLGMFCGLAGSLCRDDIPRLLSLRPDYLGFRGALCRDGRSSAIDPTLVHEISMAMKCPLLSRSRQ